MARQNPVLDVINGMNKPVRSMGIASGIMSQAGQSFEKGASLSLKLDMLLQEEEARLQNNVFKSQEMMQNALKAAINADLANRRLNLQEHQFNALQAQRGISNAINEKNAEANMKKTLVGESNLEFNRGLKMLNLLDKTTKVYDQATGMFKNVPTKDYKNARDTFISKFGGDYIPKPTGAVSITPPAAVNQSGINEEQYREDETRKPATIEMPKTVDTTVTSVKDAATLAGKYALGGITLTPTQKEDIKAYLGEDYFDKLSTAEDIRLGELLKKKQAEKAALKKPGELNKMGQQTYQRPDGSLQYKPSTNMITYKGATVPSAIETIVNGKPVSINAFVAVTKAGKITKSQKEATQLMPNPDAIVAISPSDKLYENLADNYADAPASAKSLFVKRSIDALAKMRPDIVISEDFASNIAAAFNMNIDKTLINKITTSLRTHSGKMGDFAAKQAERLLGNIKQYSSLNAKLDHKVEKTLDEFILGAKEYSYNPSTMKHILEGMTNITNDRLGSDDYTIDPEALRKDVELKILEEYRSKGFSPTYAKVRSFNEAKKNNFDIPFYGNARFDYNPAEVLKRDFEDQGMDKKAVNTLMYKLLGSSKTRYFSNDELDARKDREAQYTSSLAAKYGDFVDILGNKVAAGYEFGAPNSKLNIVLPDGTSFKVKFSTAKKILAWQYASRIEKAK